MAVTVVMCVPVASMGVPVVTSKSLGNILEEQQEHEKEETR